MNKKTALYVRVSKSDGSQKTDSQEHEIRHYCKARGWSNLELYADKASGGRSSRPALDRLVKDMRKGGVARVVVYKLDRCGRSLTHLCVLLDEMGRLKVPLICTSQGIDTSEKNPVAKFQVDVLLAVCEFERSLIRERVNAGLASARARGITLGRPATLTRRRTEVMALKKKGMGTRAIARALKMPVSSVSKLLLMGEEKGHKK